jgi:hypothetical protein
MALFRVYQFEEADGLPYGGVKLYHYAAGTTTDKDIWIDEGETTPLSQPHQGDSRGVIWFYGSGLYRLRFETAGGILLYDWDNVEISEGAISIDQVGDCEVGHVLKFVGPDNEFECGLIDLTENVEGILPCANGGTGNTCPTANGQLLIGNTTTGKWAKNTLTAGTGISVTNTAGAIEIAASAGTSQTIFGSIGISGFNNATTPDTKFDISAIGVTLKSSTTTTTITQFNTGSITNDVSVAAAANGRDQSAAFPSGSWLYLYFIWNGTALATITSLNAPTAGPTLPTGYTHWGFATALKLDAASALLKIRLAGSWAYYQEFQTVLNAGTSTSEASVSLSAFVPPNGLAARIWSGLEETSANPGIGHIRWITGLDYSQTRCGGNGEPDSSTIVVPNVGQSLFYLVENGGGSNKQFTIKVQGFQNPNGGD